MKTWTVYCRPADYPMLYVARQWDINGSGELRPTTALVTATTLAGIRKKIPLGLSRLPRSPSDDACIVETWL